MKRSIVCLLLALCLCLGLAACGAKPSQDDANTDPAVSDNTEPQLSGKVTVYMPSPSGGQAGRGFHGKDRRRGGAVPGHHR